MGCPAGPASHRSRLQVEDAISQTSQTLQLLIEHDPVSQRVDQLRLDARLSPCAQNDRQPPGHQGEPGGDTEETLPEVPRPALALCCPTPSSWTSGAGSLRPAELGREPAGRERAMRIVLTQRPPRITVHSQGPCVI